MFNEYKVQMQQLINSASIIESNVLDAEARINEKLALVLEILKDIEGKEILYYDGE